MHGFCGKTYKTRRYLLEMGTFLPLLKLMREGPAKSVSTWVKGRDEVWSKAAYWSAINGWPRYLQQRRHWCIQDRIKAIVPNIQNLRCNKVWSRCNSDENNHIANWITMIVYINYRNTYKLRLIESDVNDFQL